MRPTSRPPTIIKNLLFETQLNTLALTLEDHADLDAQIDEGIMNSSGLTSIVVIHCTLRRQHFGLWIEQEVDGTTETRTLISVVPT